VSAPNLSDSTRPDPPRPAPDQNRTEPTRPDPNRTEPTRPDHRPDDPTRTDPNRTDPNRRPEPRTEPTRTDPNRPEPTQRTQVEAGRFPEISETDIFDKPPSPTHRLALKKYIQRLLLPQNKEPTGIAHNSDGLKMMAWRRSSGGHQRAATPHQHHSSAAAKHHNATTPQTPQLGVMQPPCSDRRI